MVVERGPVNVDVRCQEVVGQSSARGRSHAKVCGTEYTTSKSAWKKCANKCPTCGGSKARERGKGKAAR